jgi:hypothetical protein
LNFALLVQHWSEVTNIEPPDAIIVMEAPKLSPEAILAADYYTTAPKNACVWIEKKKIIDPWAGTKNYYQALERWVIEVKTNPGSIKPFWLDFEPDRKILFPPLLGPLEKVKPPKSKQYVRDASPEEIELAKLSHYRTNARSRN